LQQGLEGFEPSLEVGDGRPIIGNLRVLFLKLVEEHRDHFPVLHSPGMAVG